MGIELLKTKIGLKDPTDDLLRQQNELLIRNNMLLQQLLDKPSIIQAPMLEKLEVKTSTLPSNVEILQKYYYREDTDKFYRINQLYVMSEFEQITGDEYYDIISIPVKQYPSIGLLKFDFTRIKGYYIMGYGLWGVDDPLTDIPNYGLKTDVTLFNGASATGDRLAHLTVIDKGDWAFPEATDPRWWFDHEDVFTVEGKRNGVVDSYVIFNIMFETLIEVDPRKIMNEQDIMIEALGI